MITQTLTLKEFAAVLIKEQWKKSDLKIGKKEQIVYVKKDKAIVLCTIAHRNIIEAYKTGSNKTGILEVYDTPKFIFSSCVPYNEKDIENTLVAII